VASEGGDANTGQLWEYVPFGTEWGMLRLVFESPGAEILDKPDNCSVSPSAKAAPPSSLSHGARNTQTASRRSPRSTRKWVTPTAKAPDGLYG
jgi:hypothetical protein